MVEERTLDLDVDAVGSGRHRQDVVRIRVATARGYDRAGTGLLLSRDCTSVSALEREVERLVGELADAVASAREHFGVAEHARRAVPHESASATPAAKPRLATELHVGDVMTREVVSVGPNDPLARATAAMERGRFRHVVVVDEGQVIGVLSHRDVAHHALAWVAGLGRRAHDQLLDTTAVKEVMQAQVTTADPGWPLAQAARELRSRQIGCLPVVEGGQLVGILSEGDFVELMGGEGAPPEPPA